MFMAGIARGRIVILGIPCGRMRLEWHEHRFSGDDWQRVAKQHRCWRIRGYIYKKIWQSTLSAQRTLNHRKPCWQTTNGHLPPWFLHQLANCPIKKLFPADPPSPHPHAPTPPPPPTPIPPYPSHFSVPGRVINHTPATFQSQGELSKNISVYVYILVLTCRCQSTEAWVVGVGGGGW